MASCTVPKMFVLSSNEEKARQMRGRDGMVNLEQSVVHSGIHWASLHQILSYSMDERSETMHIYLLHINFIVLTDCIMTLVRIVKKSFFFFFFMCSFGVGGLFFSFLVFFFFFGQYTQAVLGTCLALSLFEDSTEGRQGNRIQILRGCYTRTLALLWSELHAFIWVCWKTGMYGEGGAPILQSCLQNITFRRILPSG